jgi:hypothetical protein
MFPFFLIFLQKLIFVFRIVAGIVISFKYMQNKIIGIMFLFWLGASASR